jgi:phosphatidylcholine synthase
MTALSGWFVHIYTACSAIVGLVTIEAICRGRYAEAFWWMGLAVFIDATDGTLARKFRVSETVPKIDGALLDNLADFVNYVITPCFLLLMTPMLAPDFRWPVLTAIILSSAYQFTQTDAKTEDHYFKGFPCYWNFVVFFLFIWDISPLVNSAILLVLSGLVFVPIKYVYPSRMENVFKSRALRLSLLFACVVFGAACLRLLWLYPKSDPFAFGYSVLFVLLYGGVSLYRTFRP